MDIRKNAITCDQVNQVDMVEYLSSLGYSPSTIKHDDHWYLSPLRNERTASFKVNRKGNVWYDHGLGVGGNLVDFGIRYHHCSVKELLEKFNGTFLFQQQPVKMIAAPKEHGEQKIKIVSEKELHTLSLLRYIKQRRITENVARQYCREVVFEINHKKYAAIGFKNNEGGFELRNQWFKGSCSPKAVTTVLNGSKDLSVFEGFFNFLSYQTIFQQLPPAQSDFLILNSVSLFQKARPCMEEHNRVRLFLDRDKTGQNCSQSLVTLSKKYSDESKLYEGYNDLNEWVLEMGRSKKKGLQQPNQ